MAEQNQEPKRELTDEQVLKGYRQLERLIVEAKIRTQFRKEQADKKEAWKEKQLLEAQTDLERVLEQKKRE